MLQKLVRARRNILVPLLFVILALVTLIARRSAGDSPSGALNVTISQGSDQNYALEENSITVGLTADAPDKPTYNDETETAGPFWDWSYDTIVKLGGTVNDLTFAPPLAQWPLHNNVISVSTTSHQYGEWKVTFYANGYYNQRTKGQTQWQKVNAKGGQRDVTFALVRVQVRAKRFSDANWSTSGVSIAAGGRDSNVHKAQVEVEVQPALNSYTYPVSVSLTGGGGGFTPSAWWWNSNNAKVAKLDFNGSTYTFGESDPIKMNPGGTLPGVLWSSNLVESTTIKANIPALGLSKTCDVSFAAPDIVFDLGAAQFPIDQWYPYTVSVSLGGVPVDGHELTIVVEQVTLSDGTTKTASLGNSGGDSTSLDDYVLVDQGAFADHSYEDITTAAGLPSVSTHLNVIDATVISVKLRASDMSVAQ